MSVQLEFDEFIPEWFKRLFRRVTMSRITILTELRGIDVEIELSVSPPDRSVGIMGYSFEEETISDGQGNLLDWELTDDESEHVCNKIEEYMEGNWPEEDYEYMKDD